MKYFLSALLVFSVFSNTVYAVSSYETCSHLGLSSPFQGFIERLTVDTTSSLSYPEIVTPNSIVAISIENMNIDCSSDYNIGTETLPPTCPQTLEGVATLGDMKFGTLFASRNNPTFDGGASSMGSQSGVYYGSLVTQNFTAPSTLGTQTISGVCSVDRKNKVFDRSYQVVATACSDSFDNDNDGLADANDPQCHTDCDVSKPGSYASNHNSETTPPNGTCPTPPTLELNARAAFFQVVKNFIAFITTKAFAGE